MKHYKIELHHSSFKVLGGSRTSQAAIMILQPGESSGPFANEHPAAEQWLFVISGIGKAKVNTRCVKIEANSLLHIERRARHQIQNIGNTPLLTLNIYIPPAYTARGEVKAVISRFQALKT